MLIRMLDEVTGEPVAGNVVFRAEDSAPLRSQSVLDRQTNVLELEPPPDATQLVYSAVSYLGGVLEAPFPETLEVTLQRGSEIVVAANQGHHAFVKLRGREGQKLPELYSGDRRRWIVYPAQAMHFSFLTPGQYAIDVEDDLRRIVASVDVEAMPWETAFVAIG